MLRITVEEVFFQCARALLRSKLWGETKRPATLPTAGDLLQSATGGAVDGKVYDADAPARLSANLY